MFKEVSLLPSVPVHRLFFFPNFLEILVNFLFTNFLTCFSNFRLFRNFQILQNSKHHLLGMRSAANNSFFLFRGLCIPCFSRGSATGYYNPLLSGSGPQLAGSTLGFHSEKNNCRACARSGVWLVSV